MFNINVKLIWEMLHDEPSMGKTKLVMYLHYPTGLDIGLWQPLARGASESENPLAPQKIHWPPQKHVMTQMFSRREFMISRVKLQTFVH